MLLIKHEETDTIINLEYVKSITYSKHSYACGWYHCIDIGFYDGTGKILTYEKEKDFIKAWDRIDNLVKTRI